MISLLGDWAGRLALTVLVLERTGSPAWAAAVTAVSLAGFVGIGQVLATFADRYGRITVMLAADVARAGLFLAMLLDVPVGVLLVLAFLAGLATPPFEAARSAALPDLVPEDRYRDSLALSGMSVQFSLVLGYALGGLLLTVVDPESALAINACSFLVSAALLLGLRNSAAARPASVRSTVVRSLGDGAAMLFGDRMVRRALVFVSVTGALGTVDEALVVPYSDHIGLPDGLLGLLAASIPVGTLVATTIIAGGRRDHHSLLRTAAWCGAITSALAAPLFWFEASGTLAFVAFAISGGMFAVSIPTNAVIGLRLTPRHAGVGHGDRGRRAHGQPGPRRRPRRHRRERGGLPARDRRGAGRGGGLQPVGRGHDPRGRQAPRGRPSAARRLVVRSWPWSPSRRPTWSSTSWRWRR